MTEMQEKLKGKKCDKCGAAMEIKRGRYGMFLGCSGYPKCKNIQSIVKKVGVKCPDCGGQLVEKHARKSGKAFYGCDKYPKCKYAIWDKPVEDPCPECKGIAVEKKDKIACTMCDWSKDKPEDQQDD